MDMQAIQHDADNAVIQLGQRQRRAGQGLIGAPRPLRQGNSGRNRANGRNVLDHLHYARTLTLRHRFAAHLRRTIEQMQNIAVLFSLVCQAGSAGGWKAGREYLSWHQSPQHAVHQLAVERLPHAVIDRENRESDIAHATMKRCGRAGYGRVRIVRRVLV